MEIFPSFEFFHSSLLSASQVISRDTRVICLRAGPHSGSRTGRFLVAVPIRTRVPAGGTEIDKDKVWHLHPQDLATRGCRIPRTLPTRGASRQGGGQQVCIGKEIGAQKHRTIPCFQRTRNFIATVIGP